MRWRRAVRGSGAVVAAAGPAATAAMSSAIRDVAMSVSVRVFMPVVSTPATRFTLTETGWPAVLQA
jgi:hypothetical protein